MKMSQKVGIMIGIILLIPLWVPLMLRIAGYYVNEPGWRIAEKAVAQNNVNLCSKIIVMPWSVFIPSTTEQRDLCIYEYASATHDARVCEALLPSRYGISCIGAAQDWPYGDCLIPHKSEPLRCKLPGDQPEFKRYEVTQIDDCDAYEVYNNRSVVLWCLAERANVHGELEPCLAYAQSDEERDTCRYLRATNLDDVRPDVCETISNTSIRLGCATEVKAWITYPKLLENMRQYRRWVNE